MSDRTERTDCPVCEKPLSEHSHHAACSEGLGCIVKRICDNCNREYVLAMGPRQAAGYCQNNPPCPHCGVCDQPWILITPIEDAWNSRAETAAERIVAECLRAMPVNNIKTHTPESLPGRISDMAAALSAETAALEKAEDADLTASYWKERAEICEGEIEIWEGLAEKAEARVQELEAALEPIAAHADACQHGSGLPPTSQAALNDLERQGGYSFQIPWPLLRAARAAIAKQDQNQNQEGE